MASTLRVHTLAKELGVPSKVIISKCRAEGIELKNHMAALSIGLAESIREWFTTGDDITSVEIADPIELEKVRKEPPAPSPEQDDEFLAEIEPTTAETAEETQPAAPETDETPTAFAAESEAPATETAVAEAEPPAADDIEPPATEVPPLLAEVPSEAPTEAPEAETPPEAPAEQDAVEQRPAATAAEPTAPTEPETAPTTPPETTLPSAEEVRPAGPQLVPKPAELQGPRVVRIEAPEPHRPPRPRPRPAAARAPTTDEPPSSSPRRGRPGRGGRTDEAEARGKARSPRRHGSAADVDQRVREWRDQDLIERRERLASATGHGLQRRRAAERRRQATVQSGSSASPRKDPVSIATPIAIKDFCAAVGVPFALISKKLMEHTGRLWTINQSLDSEQAELLGIDIGVPIQVEKTLTAYEQLREDFSQRELENLQFRPPVVAMLGHVDHGKTSLLDRIRQTHVAAGEAGGITQHIGAYRIDSGDWHVTFVDTPGHEAFTAMRARGANLTDVVVLVVAADDGVMPQTIEAINHAKAAGVQIVVALNKIDLPGADLNRIYSQLSEHGLVPSEWGGDTDVIKTSATAGTGIDELLAHLSTLSDLLELRADASVPAHATVIEARLVEGQGIVAQVLVRQGTLQTGQTIVCGPGSGRVRAMRDDRGKPLKKALPGTPVAVSGLDELPEAGDDLYVVPNLSTAKTIAEEVRETRRQSELAAASAPKPRSLEALVLGDDSEIPQLTVILKADTQGSIEVLLKSLEQFPDEKVRVNPLHTGIGAISEADVNLAKAAKAMIIGFHVVAEDRARQLADQLGVELRLYRVIYEILEDIEKSLTGMLEPEQREEVRGKAEVRQVFHISRVGTIAGCYVTDGTIHRNHRARLVRDGVVIAEGRPLASLKRFKDDAREVRAGFECGIRLADFNDVKIGDVIEAYEVVEVAQQL